MGDFQILAAWRRWLSAQGHSPNTIRLYAIGAHRFLSEIVQDGPAAGTEEHVVIFLENLSNHAPAKEKYFRGVRSLYEYCLPRGLATIDPTAGVKLRRSKRQRDTVVLEEEELFRVLCAAHLRSPKRGFGLMVHFGLGTRRMEIAAVRPADVLGNEVELLHCKGGKRRRVPLSGMARAGLEGLRPYMNGTILGGIRPQQLTEWAKQAARDAGLYPKVRGRTTHVFRATYATYLLRRGLPVEVVRDLLGHESIATTNVYAVSDPKERHDGVAGSGL